MSTNFILLANKTNRAISKSPILHKKSKGGSNCVAYSLGKCFSSFLSYWETNKVHSVAVHPNVKNDGISIVFTYLFRYLKIGSHLKKLHGTQFNNNVL